MLRAPAGTTGIVAKYRLLALVASAGAGALRATLKLLACFLAYVPWKTLEQWQQRAGLGNSPRTILEELSRIQSTDVVLPLADDSRRQLRIRRVVHPDKAQGMLLGRLGLRLPEG